MAPNGLAGSWDELWNEFRWELPTQYNIARECCGRWAEDRARFALFFEDADGATSAWTFWDIQRDANRLSNVLAAMGVMRGDRVAILLPQCPEAAISHIACYQMGAVVLPLARNLDAEALAYRLAHAEARVAIVDAVALEGLAPVRDSLPGLKHVIGVGGARESWVREWSRLAPLASTRYTPVATAAADPALLVYTAGAGDHVLGVPLAQRALAGNLPAFACAHGFYPKPGDMLWSPVDWADVRGLFGALLPAWSFGQPVLAYNGGFDAGKACWLARKYEVKNMFLTAPQLAAMTTAQADLAEMRDLGLRSIVCAGRLADAGFGERARATLGVAINEVYGQVETGFVVGDCAAVYARRPGALGRAYPGHRVAILNGAGRVVLPGVTGELCVRRYCHGEPDPALCGEYWRNPQAIRGRQWGDGADAWLRTGDLALQDDDGYFWFQGRIE